jgi:CubicO group peptidase (beta-lactamase class C family)
MKRIVIAALLAAVTVTVGIVSVPRPAAPSTDTSGDAALVERARPLLVGARGSVAIALIDGGEVEYAFFGADENTDFEIGSITKTFTGSLLADAIERGEVRADERLGDILPLDQAPVADVTLEELATHTSGLPRIASGGTDVAGSLWATFRHQDPYGADIGGLIEQARTATLDGRGTHAYSNLGIALLGQALAEAAGLDYAELVQQRILNPLGMKDSYAPIVPTGLRPGFHTGMNAQGHPEAPWTMKASAPAGGIRSTIADMTVYAQAQLDGTAPGASALDPRLDAGDGLRIGFNWFTSEVDGEELQWHNGGTGGYASIVVLDRSTDRAVVVLSNTAASVDTAGFTLLTGEK